MRKRLSILILASLFSLSCTGVSFAGKERFTCHLGKKEAILRSGEAVFIVSSANTEEAIAIEDSTGILPYYRLTHEQAKRVIISGRHLKGCFLLKDDSEEKIVKAIFSPCDELQLELILSIKRGLPCLFVKSLFHNTGSCPLNITFEWFTNRRFEKYLAENNQVFVIPDKIQGMDMTQHLMGKTNWQTIGISPHDHWIYLLPAESFKQGLGIIMPWDKPTFFGIRGDRLSYWGEVRTLIEEGEKTGYDFILIPAETTSEFTRILKDVYPH